MGQLSLIEEAAKSKSKTLMKNKFIKDLKTGEQIANFLGVVKDIKKGKTSQNKDFIDIILSDRTGEIAGKIWEDSINNCEDFEVGSVVSIGGKITEFKDKAQITITFCQKAEVEDTSEFIPASNQDSELLVKKILKHIDGFTNSHLKALAENFYKDKEIIKEIKTAPAAERLHHAYIGGFVEHLNEMLTLADTLCVLYPQIDADLLKIGILFHDLGKLEELGFNHTIYRTHAGALVGHLLLGAITTSIAIDKIKGFPALLKTKVLHLIASHHGKLEFGSTVPPQTIEAIALNHLDDISTKVNVAAGVLTANADSSTDFSDRIYAFDNTKLFLK